MIVADRSRPGEALLGPSDGARAERPPGGPQGFSGLLAECVVRYCVYYKPLSWYFSAVLMFFENVSGQIDQLA